MINKKDKELLLKYVSGDLSREEENLFEEKLAGSVEFRRELEKTEANLAAVKKLSQININESYLNTLGVKAKGKKEQRNGFIPSVRYALYISAVLAIAYFLFPAGSGDPDSGFFAALDTASQETLAEYYDNRVFNFFNETEYSLAEGDSLFAEEDIFPDVFDDEKNIAVNYILDNNNYSDIENLTTEEFDNLYSQLENTKIF